MSDAWIRAVVLVCTFGAVLLAAEAIISWLGANRSARRAINERLTLIGQGRTRAETLNLLRRSGAAKLAEGLPPLFSPIVLKLERLLVGAQVKVPLSRALLLIVAVPLGLFLLIAITKAWMSGSLGAGQVVMIAAFCGAVGVFLPVLFLQAKANRTRKRMEEQFPVALDVFVRGLRAGHPIASALDLLTVEMPDPIGSEFGIVVDEVTYGSDLRDSLQAMADRWDMDDMRMFVVSLAVQSETGGNLAEILENLSKVIRERASMMMKVRALSSEGRMTALMLTVLPVFAFAMLFVFNPQFYLEVADDPAFLPGFGFLILLYCVGSFTIRRMVDLKV